MSGRQATGSMVCWLLSVAMALSGELLAAAILQAAGWIIYALPGERQ